MADAGNTGTADDKDSKGDVTINNNFAGANINNLGNLLQDSSSQTTNLDQTCSHAPSSEAHSTEATLPASAPPRKRSATFVIEGSIKDLTPTELARLQAFVASLRKRTGDASLTVTEFSEGSIRITLEGAELGIAKLQELIAQGELTSILGMPVRNIEFSSSDISNEKIDAVNDPLKDFLVEAIISMTAHQDRISPARADLSGVDLSGVDLSGTFLKRTILGRANLRDSNLSGTNLNCANLARANLRRANVQGANLGAVNLAKAQLRAANLSDANLSGANLFGANLRGADLSGADLSGADLFGANLRETNLSRVNFSRACVEYAVFSRSKGLTGAEAGDLIARGAIFDDHLGDRSLSLFPVAH